MFSLRKGCGMRRAWVHTACVLAVFGAAVSGAHAELRLSLDGDGNILWDDSRDSDSAYRIPASGPTKVLKQTGIEFSVTFEDVENSTGFGFDDSAEGAARQATVMRVLEYIDTTLDETGSVDILFIESADDTTNTLASAGPFFNDSTGGFSNGFAFEHITTGIDPSGDTLTDIQAQVNFGNDWHAGVGNPSSNEFDLFSVLLHELSHGLGLLSLVSADGSSVFGAYSVWDGYLEIDSGSDLFALVPEPTFLGSASDLTGGEVSFLGPAADRFFGAGVPITSDSPFSNGTSLSHVDASISGDAVMNPSLFRGATVRQYREFEIAMLQDLGYTTAIEQFCPSSKGGSPDLTTLENELSGVAWDPAALNRGDKIVYGDDDRLDVYELSDPILLNVAAATCALIQNSNLTENADGTFTALPNTLRPLGRIPCAGEPFSDQPTAASCSGFLVASDLIATAGHCIGSSNSSSLQGFKFVFGFDMEDANTAVLTFEANQVYSGTEVVSRAFDNATSSDYSVIRLDRAVTAPGAAPLDIRRSDDLPVGTALGVSGHPTGLPKKVAASGETQVMANCNDVFFVANVDTFGGNSGSPVFNLDTGVVEGILVRGDVDYLVETVENCSLVNRVVDGAGREESTKTSVFAEFVPFLAQSAGQVTLDESSYNCGDTITVRVADSDLLGVNSIAISITTSGGDTESLTLDNISDSIGETLTAVFEGEISTQEGSPSSGNGTLEVSDGGTITASYTDADDGSGSAAVSTSSADAVCRSMQCIGAGGAGVSAYGAEGDIAALLAAVFALAIASLRNGRRRQSNTIQPNQSG